MSRSGWSRRWPRRLFGATAILLGALTFAAVVVGPEVARHVAETRLGRLLGRKVMVARVRLNPFTLSVTVEGVRVLEADGHTPFAGFSRLYVNLEAVSLLRRAPVVRQIRLDAPRVRVVRARAARAGETPLAGYNFSDVVARLWARPRSVGPAAAPRFALANLQIVDGAVTFEDRPSGSRHELAGLTVGVPFLSTLPHDVDVFVRPELSVRVDGAPFALEASGRPFKRARETTAALRISGLDLRRWLALAPGLPVDVVSASLSAALEVTFLRRAGQAPLLLVEGGLTLDGLAVRSLEGAPLLRLDQLAVSLGPSDVVAARFVVEKIAVTGLDVRVRRLRDGTLDWLRVVDALRATSPPATRPPPADGGESPSVAIAELALENAVVHLRDESVRPPVELALAPITVRARGLSNARGARGAVTLTARVRPGGTASLRGTLTLAPLSAAGRVTLEGLEPRHFAPYFRDRLAVDVPRGRADLAFHYDLELRRRGPHLTLSEGALALSKLVVRRRGDTSAQPFLRLPRLAVEDAAVDLDQRVVSIGRVVARDGWLRVTRAGATDVAVLSSSAATELDRGRWTVRLAHVDLDRWTARLEVANVAARDARARGEAVRWQSLQVGGVALSTAPFHLAVRDVALGGFEARLVRPPDPTSKAARAPPEGHRPAAPATAPAPSRRITIERLTLRGGRVGFHDPTIRPPYSVEVGDLSGRFSGLSTTADGVADVEVTGRFDRAATFSIAGKLNPLHDRLFLDLKGSLSNFDLPPVSAYLGPRVGFAITKGKVSLDLACRVAGGELASTNRIVINQLQLGNKVAGARRVPLRLAVRVLEDRRGVIDLDLPVAGSVDDPRFDLGGTILTALDHAIGKAVTAPFAILGSLFGGGAELSRVDFPAGLATLDAQAGDKVRALAKALRERPALSFEISGDADPARDRVGGSQALSELARRRGLAVRDALARAEPAGAVRLFLVSPKVVAGAGGGVALRLKEE